MRSSADTRIDASASAQGTRHLRVLGPPSSARCPPPSHTHLRPAQQDALKTLRGELAAVLGDVEAELDQLGGSASTVSARTHTTAKSTAKSFKSMAASVAASVPRSIAEE